MIINSGSTYTQQCCNVFLGDGAGYSNTVGDSSIFIGHNAGAFETASYRLYIENSRSDSENALIYGEFDNDIVKLNATAHIRDALVLKPRDTAPSSPEVGTMYIDSSDSNKLKVWDGAIWQPCW